MVEKYTLEYGEVPPPWIYAPNTHPYSIGWRMGGGETFVMVFGEWFDTNFSNESDRITYFKRYPPPPRWMAWMADSIWDLEPWEEPFDYAPYFQKLVELGFDGVQDYEKDLEDEKWLNHP